MKKQLVFWNSNIDIPTINKNKWYELEAPEVGRRSE